MARLSCVAKGTNAKIVASLAQLRVHQSRPRWHSPPAARAVFLRLSRSAAACHVLSPEHHVGALLPHSPSLPARSHVHGRSTHVNALLQPLRQPLRPSLVRVAARLILARTEPRQGCHAACHRCVLAEWRCVTRFGYSTAELTRPYRATDRRPATKRGGQDCSSTFSCRRVCLQA